MQTSAIDILRVDPKPKAAPREASDGRFADYIPEEPVRHEVDKHEPAVSDEAREPERSTVPTDGKSQTSKSGESGEPGDDATIEETILIADGSDPDPTDPQQEAAGEPAGTESPTPPSQTTKPPAPDAANLLPPATQANTATMEPAVVTAPESTVTTPTGTAPTGATTAPTSGTNAGDGVPAETGNTPTAASSTTPTGITNSTEAGISPIDKMVDLSTQMGTQDTSVQPKQAAQENSPANQIVGANAPAPVAEGTAPPLVSPTSVKPSVGGLRDPSGAPTPVTPDASRAPTEAASQASSSSANSETAAASAANQKPQTPTTNQQGTSDIVEPTAQPSENSASVDDGPPQSAGKPPQAAPGTGVQTASAATATAVGNEIKLASDVSPLTETATGRTASNAAAHQVAVQINRAIMDGQDKFTVNLRPAALGRVTVEFELGHDNRVIAVISAERADTLDLLQRDARALERALQDAGLKTDSDSLSFSLQGDSEENPLADQDVPGQSVTAAFSNEDADTATAVPNPYAPVIDGSGVDIHV